mgnify:CR=1 FL=1
MYYDTHWYCAPLESMRDNRTHALVRPIKGEPQFNSPGLAAYIRESKAAPTARQFKYT